MVIIDDMNDVDCRQYGSGPKIKIWDFIIWSVCFILLIKMTTWVYFNRLEYVFILDQLKMRMSYVYK